MKNQLSRRKFLQWTTPLITAVSLPAHAECSESFDPNASPVVTGDVKCVLNTVTGLFLGEMVITIASTGGDILINAINTSGAGANDTFVLPDLPVAVSSTSPVTLTWEGESSDGITCLPVSNFQIEIIYGCNNMGSSIVEVNALDLLI